MRCTFGWAGVAVVLVSAATSAWGQPGPAKLAPLAPAQPAAPATKEPATKEAPKPDPVVEQLIKDLGAEDYRTREKAGRDLAARGEKVLPALKAALASTDIPEVQRRLLVMVRKMDYERLVAPKLVSLSLKDKTVKEAFAEITKQTGYKIDYNNNGVPRGNTETKHNFEFTKLPFWEAMDKVAGASGCSVFNDFNEDETIQVYNQDIVNPYVAYAGPFRFIANNINSNRNLQLAGLNRRGGMQNRQEFINLNFQIQSEPKNPMLGITHVDVLAASDELGGSLVPPRDPNNRVNYFNGIFRGHNTYGGLNLLRADRNANTVKILKARAGITLLSGTVPEIVITDPLKVKGKSFTGRSVEIDFGGLTEDANNKGHYSLELTAKRLGSGGGDQDRGEDFNWGNCMWQRIEVLDAAGNRYPNTNGNNFPNNGGGTIQLSMPLGPEDRRTGQSAKLGPPAKVLINEWISVVHEVTFEFKDLPLP